MARIDITIRGAGIFGLSIAWEAISRGARVRVLDPGDPGAGASGGIVGALQPHTPDGWNAKKAFQRDALLIAPGFWGAVEGVSGVPTGYRPAGRLQPLPHVRAVEMAKTREGDAAQNWEGAVWEVVEAPGGAWCPPSPTGLFVRDTLSALIHPRRAVDSLARALERRGVEIAVDAPDKGMVVHATGWRGLLDLSDAMNRPVGGGVKGQAALLAFDAGEVPQIFADGLHIVPHGDGTVAVGSTSERDFEDAAATDAQADDLVRRARDILPVLGSAEVIETWAGVRPRATTRAPLLGWWPGREGHAVANGGFKIGFGIAPMVAKVICDLVLDGRQTFPEEFRLSA